MEKQSSTTLNQQRIVTDSGTPIWISGKGPTLVLVHGVMVDHRMWAPQVRALSSNYRVCCIDMLGHGDAPDPLGARTLGDFVVQLDEVIDKLTDKGLPVLGGFSMGGLVAQAYAIKHSEKLSGLILMNCVHNRTPDQTKTVIARYEDNLKYGAENAVMSGATRWFTPDEQKTHASEIEDALNWIRDGDFAAKCKAHRVFATSDKEVNGKLSAVSCPALVMTGDRDKGSTPEMAIDMAGQISDSVLRVLDGQHHMMTILDSDRVNREIVTFLDDILYSEKS
ncbi:MAG: alpha/beta fold hydrolase [Paracoccaceae bacterium]